MRVPVPVIPTAVGLSATALIAPLPAEAQHDHGAEVSPYASFQDREIRALSNQELRGLLRGEGLGFALAAELNGHPGPKHALELADSLQLTAEQRDAVEAIERDMQREARRFGAGLVEMERRLDEAFAAGTVGRSRLRRLVLEAARLRGELRAVHLEAHLKVTEVLEPHQVRRYVELRGYGSGHGEHGS